jgi:hypothetical protein
LKKGLAHWRNLSDEEKLEKIIKSCSLKSNNDAGLFEFMKCVWPFSVLRMVEDSTLEWRMCNLLEEYYYGIKGRID